VAGAGCVEDDLYVWGDERERDRETEREMNEYTRVYIWRRSLMTQPLPLDHSRTHTPYLSHVFASFAPSLRTMDLSPPLPPSPPLLY
jgi:hypothetical protein